MPSVSGSHHKLEVPDYPRLRKEAEDAVKDELGRMARPDDRVERAAEVIRQADLEIAAHVDDRNKFAASLWFYERTRGLPKVMGLTTNAYRQALYRALYGIDPRSRKDTDPFPAELPASQGAQAEESLDKIAARAGIPHFDPAYAGERLPELSRIVAEAAARRKVALEFLQDGALALSEEPYGWDGYRIAEHAGVSVKLVWKHWAVARKRRGH
ncbi:hypothetical protein [Streptomyces subrutilus]|uniref:Uncharacterized protein n=1 Tax=Streptomyces subrutilus TaxID=36818 RepID=A0A1E5NXU1_9ACTN|nr:hypothetical protein [Streptomyces subrutilus]OEJ21060.1 hypothetical protein BGK67_34775 [Streptomyces subrutilus]